MPRSLRIILAELQDDVGVLSPSGNLQRWASNGVLLLNSTLTVGDGSPGSHVGHGWEEFTNAVIRCIDARTEPVAFLLWGGPARSKRKIIAGRHAIAESPHPAAWGNTFLRTKPFSRANAALAELGAEPISWNLAKN